MKKQAHPELEIVRFESCETGPNLLITGAIHGNEVCGPRAIRQAIKLLQSGKWQLLKGSITFIPVCNPEAFRQKKRFIEVNLNRVIKTQRNPERYEERIVPLLTKSIDGCDALLDIHSTGTQGPACVFQDYTDAKTKAFAHSLGFPSVISGWPEMYATKHARKFNEGDSISYAHQKKKVAVLIECGYHNDPVAINYALKAIQSAAIHLGLLTSSLSKHKKIAPKLVNGYQFFSKEKEGCFTKKWKHLDPIRKGEAIVIHADGTTLIAPQKGFIILPKPHAKVGQEWFYLGV